MIIKNKDFQEFAAFSVFFYAIPVVLLSTGFLPWGTHNLVLVTVGLILVAYAISKEISLKSLGFRADNLKKSLINSALITAFGLVALSFLWGFGLLESNYGQNSVLFYLFYIAISAPLQEFIFRSLMFYELDLFLGKGRGISKVLISTLVYSLSHAAYRDLSIIGITFLVGLFWGYLYLKTPNFWAVAISHIILGAATVALGII